MKKKIMFILCTITILLIGSIVNAATTLSDIKNTKYEDSVNTLITLGVVNGYPEDNTYRPNNTVTRAEMAKLMVVCLGEEGKVANAAKSASKFKDVTSSNWEVGYVNVAADLGIINGYPDGTFGSKNTVSYAEATAMVLRALEYESEVEKSTEVWPNNYISYAKGLSLYSSMGTISANDGAKRGNVAILLWNMLRTGVCTPIGQNGTVVVYGEGEKLLNKKMSKFTYLEDVLVNDVDFDSSYEKADVKLVGDETITIEIDATDATKMFGRRFDILYNTSSKKIISQEETSDYKEKKGEVTKIKSGKIYLDESSTGYALPSSKNILLYGVDDIEDAVTATLILDGSSVKYVIGYAPDKVYLALVTDTGVTVSKKDGIKVVNYKSSSSKSYALEDEDADVDVDDIILYYLNDDNELVILEKSDVSDSTEIDTATSTKITAGKSSYKLSDTSYEIVKVKSSSLVSMSVSSIEEDEDSLDVITYAGKRYYIIYIGGEDEAIENLEKEIDTACDTLSTYMKKSTIKTAYTNEKNYTFSTYATFANAYDDAEDTITTAKAKASNSNLTKVKNAYTTLQNAYSNLKKITTLSSSAKETELEKINAKISLRKLVNGETSVDGKKVTTCVENQSLYETTSYSKFNSALSSAKTLLRSTSTTKTKLDNAYTKLSTEMTNLKTKAEDTERVTALNALNATITEAEKLKDNKDEYNESAYNIFLSYLSAAGDVAKSSTSTKEEINDANENLKDAMEVLSVSDNSSVLKSLLKDAETELAKEETYMPETYNALKEAYENGKKASTAKEISTAIKALNTALDGLINVDKELERLIARGKALDIETIKNANTLPLEYLDRVEKVKEFTELIKTEETAIRKNTVLLRDAVSNAKNKTKETWNEEVYKATWDELVSYRTAAENVLKDIDAGKVVNSKTIISAYENLDAALTTLK